MLRTLALLALNLLGSAGAKLAALAMALVARLERPAAVRDLGRLAVDALKGDGPAVAADAATLVADVAAPDAAPESDSTPAR